MAHAIRAACQPVRHAARAQRVQAAFESICIRPFAQSENAQAQLEDGPHADAHEHIDERVDVVEGVLTISVRNLIMSTKYSCQNEFSDMNATGDTCEHYTHITPYLNDMSE